MTSHEPKNPRVVLVADHRRIVALLDRLIACVRADDREAGQKAWRKVEGALLAHLNVEEMFVFPALRAKFPAEIDGLRREHDALRHQLGELGLAFELHTVREPQIESFCAALRDHAEREDSLAYPEAERTLPVGVARSIAARITAAVTPRRGSRLRHPFARSAS